MKKILHYYNTHLSHWVIIFAAVAYFFPSLFMGVKSFINLFFAITMFGIGLVITEEDYRNIVRSPRQILIGNLFQFTIMPLLALVTARLFSLSDTLTVGLILTGSAPGAMTSNVISYLSGGDVAYSVSLTAVATLLCPVLTPFLTWLLAGHMVPIPFASMFLTIIYTVVAPLFLGFCVRKALPSLINRIDDMPAAISVTSIVIITSYVVAANRGNLGKATLIIFIAVIFHNFAGMLLGYLGGHCAGFSFKRKKTLSIEIGMQNAGLGVILALKHFSAEVAIPAAIFTIWCILSASILVNFWEMLELRSARARH